MPISVICLASLLVITFLDVNSLSQRSAGTQPAQEVSPGYSSSPSLSRRVLYNGSKHRHPGYTSGSCHLDTLSWAVKLKDESFLSSIFSHQILEERADIVAKETGMINEGPIGHFTDIYLFAHPDSKHLRALCPDYQRSRETSNKSAQSVQTFQPYNKPVSFSTSAKNTAVHIPREQHQPLLNLELEDAVADKVKSLTEERQGASLALVDIIKYTEEKLDEHRYVEWYTRQTVRRRTKRSLSFNDPDFNLQWHLVRNVVVYRLMTYSGFNQYFVLAFTNNY